jgi:hypothetical protein
MRMNSVYDKIIDYGRSQRSSIVLRGRLYSVKPSSNALVMFNYILIYLIYCQLSILTGLILGVKQVECRIEHWAKLYLILLF